MIISAEDQNRLSQAIAQAESATVGEIVVVLAERSGSYRTLPALWALLIALIVPWPLILFTGFSATRIFMLQIAIGAGLSLLFSWPKLQLALVPGFLKRARAHEAATREFVSRGLTRTRGRTGILIYVSAEEHYAEIIADIGIADQAGPQTWQDIIAELIAAFKADRAGDGLVRAVEQAGAILARHAPPASDDTDELPNKIILL
jgi:putative membrane protein